MACKGKPSILILRVLKRTKLEGFRPSAQTILTTLQWCQAPHSTCYPGFPVEDEMGDRANPMAMHATGSQWQRVTF